MAQTTFHKLSPAQKQLVRSSVFWFYRVLATLVAPFKRIRFSLSNKAKNRLHVGCGRIRLDGWVNTDLDPRADLVVNMKRRLPFADNSLDRIFSEHVLEHLTVEEGLGFLREAYRTLKPGGVMRIGMPDLDELIDGYQSDWRRFDWLSWPGHEFIQTRAEMLNIAFRWWGHKHLYNKEELQRRLQEAGFTNIRFCEKGKSEQADLCGLEVRADTGLIAEAVK